MPEQTNSAAVVVCTDRRMLIPALRVAVSAVRHRSQNGMGYDVLLFADSGEVDDSHRHWMAQNGIRHVEDLEVGQLSRFETSSNRFGRCTLDRLLVPQFCSGRYEKILYLDADMAVQGPLAPLFSLDLEDYGIAASPAGELPELLLSERDQEKQYDQFTALGLSEPFGYFNAGCMLIDVDWWNREKIGSRALEFLLNNPDRCPFPDENALNAVLDGQHARLSPVWNMRGWTFLVPGTQKFVKPVITHYDGPNKPWKRFGDWRPLSLYSTEYREYAAFLHDTPWKDWLDEQWQFSDLVKNIKFEAFLLKSRITGQSSRLVYPASRRNMIEEAFKRYCRTAPFADVEQGIVVNHNGALQPSVSGPA